MLTRRKRSGGKEGIPKTYRISTGCGRTTSLYWRHYRNRIYFSHTWNRWLLKPKDFPRLTVGCRLKLPFNHIRLRYARSHHCVSNASKSDPKNFSMLVKFSPTGAIAGDTVVGREPYLSRTGKYYASPCHYRQALFWSNLSDVNNILCA